MLRHTLLLALVVAVAAANTDNSDMVRRMNAIIDRNFQGINKGTALKKDGRLVTMDPLLFCGALDYNALGTCPNQCVRDILRHCWAKEGGGCVCFVSIARPCPDTLRTLHTSTVDTHIITHSLSQRCGTARV